MKVLHRFMRGILFAGLVSCCRAQTPTVVQHVSCPNSRNTGGNQSSTPDYKCPLPEPSQGGNVLIVGVVSADAGAAFTVSDDKSNSWTLVDSVIDNNGAYVAVYVATNVAANTRLITLQRSNSNADDVALSASEYYNVATSSAVDGSNCNGADSNSATITAGSITPTLSGDLIWQWAVNTGGGGGLPNSVSSFTAGSHSNITWQLNGTDLYDGDAVQAGVYGSTTAINPTFTSGTSEQFTSCAVALKAASAGNAPTSSFRIVHMLHQQVPASAANPTPIQFPTSGNLIVDSFIAGGSTISSISSSPSNTWSSTGTAAGTAGNTATSQIYYAGNATPANNLTISITHTPSSNDTHMLYDIIGAATSPFDVDSGAQSGNQTSTVNSWMTCSNCVTPTVANDIVIGNVAQNWCTSTNVTAPSGGLFDAATDTGNAVNGPESVDQNNGWFHYYDSGTSALSVTWTETCGSNAEGEWAGRVAAFKSGDAAGESTLATPTFSPAAGSYSGTQSVTISGPSGATICYNTTGSPSAPTAGTCGNGSTTYTAPVSVASSETLYAIATELGYINSSAGSATYTITSSPVISGLAPTSGPVGTSVTITGTNFGATQGSSTVTFNGTTAVSITSWSATSIVAVVPAGATTGGVVVKVGSAASSGVSFTVSAGTTSSACDLNQDGVVNVLDVQLAINMDLGLLSCPANLDGGACNSTLVQQVVNAALGEGCVATISYSVALTWTASTSPNIAGYNVYRATTSGGPYTLLNSSLVTTNSYTDTSVALGQIYYYVTTAVDTSNDQSSYSNQAQATIPSS